MLRATLVLAAVIATSASFAAEPWDAIWIRGLERWQDCALSDAHPEPGIVYEEIVGDALAGCREIAVALGRQMIAADPKWNPFIWKLLDDAERKLRAKMLAYAAIDE